jgi:uncharacterized protein
VSVKIRKISEAAEGGLSAKAAELLGVLTPLEGVLVAFSGGVDSSLLLAAAVEACKESVIAATASSPIHPRRELDQARQVARLIGAKHEIIRTREMSDPRFTQNPVDRCYVCKRSLFARLKDVAAERGLGAVIEGSTVEDLSDFRPGEAALRELGILSPLRRANFAKRDVRDLARAIGLPTWDKAASACLASRFPYGTEITEDALGRVERLEDMLLGLGLKRVRARYHGDIIRIEIEPERIETITGPDVRDKIIQAARREGFRFVTLDLQGYRMGSLNPQGT